MYKSLFFILLIYFFSIAANAQQITVLSDGQIISDSVCESVPLTLEASYTHDNIKQFNWSVNGRKIYNTSSYTLANTEVGTLVIVSEVIYVEKKYRKVGKKRELCEITCHAWNSKIITVTSCPKIKPCPEIPTVSITTSSSDYDVKPITLTAVMSQNIIEDVNSRVEWIVSSGRLVITGNTTALLYPDLASEIYVNVIEEPFIILLKGV